VATTAITLFGLVLLVLSSRLLSVGAIVKDCVNAIGFQVAFYYGLTGFACAWYFRRAALRSPANMLFLLLWPAVSAGFLWGIAIYSIPTFDLATNVVGLGGLAIGAAPWLWNRNRKARVGAPDGATSRLPR